MRSTKVAVALLVALAAAPAGCGDDVIGVAPYGEQYYDAWDGPGHLHQMAEAPNRPTGGQKFHRSRAGIYWRRIAP